MGLQALGGASLLLGLQSHRRKSPQTCDASQTLGPQKMIAPHRPVAALSQQQPADGTEEIADGGGGDVVDVDGGGGASLYGLHPPPLALRQSQRPPL